MRTTGFLAATAAVLSLTAARAAEPAPAPTPVPEEIKKLHGFWKPASVKHEGQEQLPDEKTRESLTLAVINAEYRMYFSPDTNADKKARKYVRLFAADLALDPKTHTFEVSVKEGQKKGSKQHGIYEHTGSTLRLCYGPADKPRPTTFAAPAGSGLFNEVWTFECPLPAAKGE